MTDSTELTGSVGAKNPPSPVGANGTTGGVSHVALATTSLVTSSKHATSLCLVMIVKDEEEVIERCLRSAIPFISSWSIVDTGSTDRTKEIIREVLKDIPGELHERPWKNFAHNRTEMVELARGKADYDLMLDADDKVEAEEGFELPKLTHDRYEILVKYDNLTLPRPHIFKNDAGYFYESVLHEYLHKKGDQTLGLLKGITYCVVGGGKRGSDPVAKYKRDAEVLKQELLNDPNSHLAPRYVFYLAQSYRDTATMILSKKIVTQQDEAEAAKYRQKALKTYERRATMGSYYEEVFVSLVEVGKLHEQLKASERTVYEAYIKAYEFLPPRGAEPLYYLAKYYRQKDKLARAYIYSKTGASIPEPVGLFVDHDIYAWRIFDELAVAAYHTGRFAESYNINKQLLDHGGIFESEAPRIEDNLRHSKDRLAELGCTVS